MATSEVFVPKDEWTLISASSVYFQPKENDLEVTESASLPNNNSPRKIAIVRRIYVFDKTDGNLYGYSKNGCVVGLDPKA